MKTKVKFIILITFMFLAFQSTLARGDRLTKQPPLQVSKNHRFLVQVLKDGTEIPFFYLGDTAWELFYRLNKKDAGLYLETRRRQGFNVIQAVALPSLTNGLTLPDVNGYLPLRNLNPALSDIKEGPDNDYWDRMDYIVNKANKLGIYVALLPTWGFYWHTGYPEDKKIFTPEYAESYGEFLGKRYKNNAIIWVLGGDRNIENEDQWAIIRAMARGIKKGDNGTHLITFHPFGHSGSANFAHNEDWLDFNMRQNGHDATYNGNYSNTNIDYNREPVKPVLDAEPLYEDLQLSLDPGNGHSLAIDVRRAMYWDIFGGACGLTYGNHAVWQFYDPDIPGQITYPYPLMKWKEGLEQPGGKQMVYARKLLESRPFFTRIPDSTIIVPNEVRTSMPGAGSYYFIATRDLDNTYAMIYAPVGRKFSVRMDVIKGAEIKAWWYNPRNGLSQNIGIFPNQGEKSFTTPDHGEELDWILVLDDASKNYPAPGMPLGSKKQNNNN
jgi:hypothetical protein